MSGAVPPLPSTPSWRGDPLKKSTGPWKRWKKHTEKVYSCDVQFSRESEC
jgi:hypothetical protein